MDFCNQAGIPHSQFLSWGGEDRSKALAFMMEKSARCQMCGTAPWEWEEDRQAYTPIEQMCWGCYHREGTRKDSKTETPGVTVVMVPTSSLPD